MSDLDERMVEFGERLDQVENALASFASEGGTFRSEGGKDVSLKGVANELEALKLRVSDLARTVAALRGGEAT